MFKGDERVYKFLLNEKLDSREIKRTRHLKKAVCQLRVLLMHPKDKRWRKKKKHTREIWEAGASFIPALPNALYPTLWDGKKV